MGHLQRWIYPAGLLCSVILNVVFVVLYVQMNSKWKPDWSKSAAKEAEAVAAVTCSGHGRAYSDGLVVDGSPVCECNTCFEGPDCSQFSPHCAADVERYI